MNPHLIHFIVIIPFVQAACSTSRRTTRISAVCEDQYSSTLAMREETADEAFKVYMTRKAQGWFRGWGCPRPSDAAASPCPPEARGAALGLRRQRVPRHRQRRTRMHQTSLQAQCRGGGGRRSGAIANRGLGDVATRAPGAGHMPSKPSRLQPVPLIGQARLGRRAYSHWNLSWFHNIHIQICVICYLTSHVGWLWYHGQYHGQYHGGYHKPMRSELSDIIDSELWYHSFDSIISCMLSYLILTMISYTHDTKTYWCHGFIAMISWFRFNDILHDFAFDIGYNIIDLWYQNILIS